MWLLTATRTDLESTDRYLGYWGCSLHIDQNRASSSQPLNGDLPTNISYSRMPKDHQSTLWLYFWPLIIYTVNQRWECECSSACDAICTKSNVVANVLPLAPYNRACHKMYPLFCPSISEVCTFQNQRYVHDRWSLTICCPASNPCD